MVEKMLYRHYKESYSDCKTVPGTYDKESKTIDVVVPDGRMKPSGARGKSYKYLTFHGVENKTGRHVSITIKAICTKNAIARLPGDCTWDIN